MLTADGEGEQDSQDIGDDEGETTADAGVCLLLIPFQVRQQGPMSTEILNCLDPNPYFRKSGGSFCLDRMYSSRSVSFLPSKRHWRLTFVLPMLLATDPDRICTT